MRSLMEGGGICEAIGLAFLTAGLYFSNGSRPPDLGLAVLARPVPGQVQVEGAVSPERAGEREAGMIGELLLKCHYPLRMNRCDGRFWRLLSLLLWPVRVRRRCGADGAAEFGCCRRAASFFAKHNRPST